MDVYFIIALVLASPGILIVNIKYRRRYAGFLHSLLTVLTLYWSWESAGSFKPYTLELPFTFWGASPNLIIDRLAIFFIVLVNLTVMLGFVYSKGYLKPYETTKPKHLISSHYLAYFWLHLSMLLVPMVREGMMFLLVWELMSLSSFVLVIFEGEHYNTLKAGINYLIQMHVGMVFILLGFLIAYKTTGIFGFDAIGPYLSGKNNFWLFLLFFIGFGLKAGFIPLHTWLPEAHPAAPSHVSGIMSGVMIKMGIYGIIRVIIQLSDSFMAIGVFLLIISLISTIMGLLFAIVQKDLKRILAFSSIENIGIIGIGLSLGLIGFALKNNVLSILGYTGALLHILNHAVLKSLLFFSAGSVYHATHTRNIENLGGLIKHIPQTAFFFLIGIIGLSGLPPLNGFISEYIMYLGMFKSLPDSNLIISVLLLTSIILLTFTGGLAFFCFSRVFGVVFLGQKRSDSKHEIKECSSSMRNTMLFGSILAIGIGLFPLLFVKPVCKTVGLVFNLEYTDVFRGQLLENLKIIGSFGFFIVLVTSGLLYLRFRRQKLVETSEHVTWGCGYTNGDAKHQYTGSSFSENLSWLAKPVLGIRKKTKTFEENEIFPESKTFYIQSVDFIKVKVLDPLVIRFGKQMKSLAVFQTGQIQHYILYAFAFIMFIFILTYFNLI